MRWGKRSSQNAGKTFGGERVGAAGAKPSPPPGAPVAGQGKTSDVGGTPPGGVTSQGGRMPSGETAPLGGMAPPGNLSVH